MLTLGSMEVIVVRIPDGLSVCQECGCIRGTTLERGWSDDAPGPWTSTCLCDGVTCRQCGEGTVRRPVSDYYEEGGWTHVPYWNAGRHCSKCGGRTSADYRQVHQRLKRFRVLVDDNFRYMHDDERWQAGEYDDYESALSHCKRIVEECLQETLKPGMSAEQLHGMYKASGEDPWVSETPDGVEPFSAWSYARERAQEMCAPAAQRAAGELE